MNQTVKWKKADIWLLAVILAAAVFLWVFTQWGREEGAYAVVTVDGQEWGRYPLHESVRTDIVTEYGENLLVIDGGKAMIIEADCPDGLCISQKDISYEGETIVCLPHKLVVSIEGGEDTSVDGIAR